MTNGTIKLKTVENGLVYAVTHRSDIEHFLKLCCICVMLH